MRRSWASITVGALVLIVGVISYSLIRSVNEHAGNNEGYTVWAVFHDASGLFEKSRVQTAGISVGQIRPTVPTASFIAIETLRIGGLCTAPSNLSAQPAYENSRSTLRCTSSAACFFPTAAASLAFTSSLRCERFSAM